MQATSDNFQTWLKKLDEQHVGVEFANGKIIVLAHASKINQGLELATAKWLEEVSMGLNTAANTGEFFISDRQVGK